VTPSTDKNVLSVKGGIQRCLLPWQYCFKCKRWYSAMFTSKTFHRYLLVKI